MKVQKTKNTCKCVGYCSRKGITLVSLVVTIIVLIILAGISVRTIINNNGALKQATKAKEMAQLAMDKEILSNAALRFSR